MFLYAIGEKFPLTIPALDFGLLLRQRGTVATQDHTSQCQDYNEGVFPIFLPLIFFKRLVPNVSTCTRSEMLQWTSRAVRSWPSVVALSLIHI